MDVRRIVVVLGMHRSGTSVVTRSLPALGVSLGDRLMPADHFNERGYWEDLEVVAINEELLAAVGRTWHDASPVPADALDRLRGTDLERRAAELLRKRTDGGVPYGMKDPRTATVLPFWRAVFRAAELEPSFVVALRDPDLAAASLARRNGTPAAWGHWLWIGHTLAALEGSEGAPRVVVQADEMVSAPEECVRRLGHALGLPVQEPALAEFVREFVDRRLVHEVGPVEGAWAAPCPALAREMFESLASTASAGPDAILPPGAMERWRREAGNALGLVRMVELRDRTGHDREEDRVARAVLADSVAFLQRRIAELSPEPRNPVLPAGQAATAAPGPAAATGRPHGTPGGHPIRRKVRRAMRSARILLNTARGGILDADWYLSENPDVRARGVGARLHFALHGAFEGRAPNPRFRPAEYLAHRPDVASRGMPASLHFALWGFRETSIPWIAQAPSAEALPPEYARWIEHQASRPPEPAPEAPPSVSVLVPVFGVRNEYLGRLLDSLRRQDHPDWEACIACADPPGSRNGRMLAAAAANDPRIRVRFLARNLGISGNSNEALRDARGEFVALLDHDDELADGALLAMAAAAAREPEADFLYSDKDCIDGLSGRRQGPLFKPCWSPEMLYSVNYLTHLNLMRRSVVEAVGGFRPETDGAQDWDIFLRVCERSRRVVRVPGVLYHWRIHPASTSTGIGAKPYALAAQLRTVRDRVVREGLEADVAECPDSGFRLLWRIPASTAVRVLIDASNADAAGVARIRAALEREASGLPECSVTFEEVRGDHDRADALRRALEPGASDAVLLVSARVADVSDGTLRQLVGWVTCHPGVGFASALVLAPDGSVVEAGQVVDRSGAGIPLFRAAPLRDWGWFGGPLWRRNASAAGPWAIAFRAAALARAGGIGDGRLWPEALTAACVAVRDLGLRGVVEPAARATVDHRPLPQVPPFTGSDDPCFHPAFVSVSPLRLRGGPAPAPEPAAVPDGSMSEALVLARLFECEEASLRAPQQHPARIGAGPGAGWCNWHVPAIANPYYGGVMTILRIADTLARSRGMRQRFVVDSLADPAAFRAAIARAFPLLAESEVMRAPPADAIGAVPPADWSFATLWTTAYRLLRVRNTGLKLYLVQDYEPLFYPAGSTSAQAELTYRFGFQVVANTRALGAFLEREHGIRPIAFDPQVDLSVFHGDLARPASSPKRIFFYGRPGHPRNAFEIGTQALARLKRSLGDGVEIIAAGAEWDPAEHGLGGVVRNLGTLGYARTADLYRSCHACLTMMMTKHPSYLPFEFMACGGLVVSNRNPHNAWLMRDGENSLLVEPSIPTIAAGLERAILRYEEFDGIRRAGQELVRSRFGDWQGTLLRLADDIAASAEAAR